MTLRIKHLVIENFKVFERLEIQVESDYLTVLDGPNGFGKSSFFDALELLFTGSIRRYIELEELTVDGRKQKPGCPWLYNRAKPESWLSIRAELSINDEIIILERAACKEKLDKQKGLRDLNIPLYELDTLEGERSDRIKEEKDFFSNLLGESYKRDFALFHYVEQEENNRLLKQKEKDRQQQIAYLFEIGEIQERLNTINHSHSKIGKLCTAAKKENVRNLKSKWESAKQKVLAGNEFVDYQRLVNVTIQPWDSQVLDYTPEQFEQWLSDDGDVFRLKRFVQNFNHYESKLYNRTLSENLLPELDLQKSMLTFFHRLSYQKQWDLELRQLKSAENVIEAFDDTLISIAQDKLLIPEILLPIIPDDIKLDKFKDHVEHLKQEINSSDKLEESLSSLFSMRERLLESFRKFQLYNGPTNSCPTCGHDWESSEALLIGIEQQEETLRLLASRQNSQLTQKLTDFKEKYQKAIKGTLVEFIDKQLDKVDYKRMLVSLSSEQVSRIQRYASHLIDAGIQFEDLLIDNYDLKLDLPLSKLRERVMLKLKPVNDSLIFPEFDRIFRDVFNREISAVKQISTKDIENKIVYIQQQRSIASSRHAKDCELKFRNAQNTLNNAVDVRKRLKKLKEIYENQKKGYLESIVKEVEILFHIYSGRLMQSYQQGLGIFIENDGSSIAFHETPGNDYDVVFSMSSGQLSALILSFTLALNRRYAKHGLLMVDDPVQTLDEINVVGFIELLRADFSNRQIFIATHEDRMSAYFRYKYKKFGIPVGRINFMDESRAANETSKYI